MGFIFWLNFENFWPDHINQFQYPIIFLALCLGIIFAPVRVLYHRSRRWFVYANVGLSVPELETLLANVLLVATTTLWFLPSRVPRFLAR